MLASGPCHHRSLRSMASTISSLAHTHLTTSKLYHTRTRQTSVNYQLDEDTTGGSPNSTQGTAGPWYEVKEIIGEKKDKYKILWAGVDPKTNKPWKADWIKKSEVSAPAIAEWEESKRAKGSSKVPPIASAVGKAQFGQL